MLVIKEEEFKEALNTKPYPFSVTEKVYNDFPDSVKELGWVFNLKNRIYTHYFNSVMDFIHYVLLVYGEVRIL